MHRRSVEHPQTEIIFLKAKIEVKRIGANGQIQEAIYSIHINDDEGYNVSTTKASKKEKSKPIDSKKQTSLITDETNSEESNDQIVILAENDTKSDIQRNNTNRKLIDDTLKEFHHTVESVFGNVDKAEITITGDNIESTL